MKISSIIPILAFALIIAGYQLLPDSPTPTLTPTPTPTPTATSSDVLTLDTVQKSIRIGMSQTEILEAIGSPDRVFRDKDGKESWTYDKSSTTAHSQCTLTLFLEFNEGILDEYSYSSRSF